ncbi:hypothetical protein D3C75_581050 [compost metagenome]
MKQARIFIQKIWKDVFYRLVHQMHPAIYQLILLQKDIFRADPADLERRSIDILTGLA